MALTIAGKANKCEFKSYHHNLKHTTDKLSLFLKRSRLYYPLKHSIIFPFTFKGNVLLKVYLDKKKKYQESHNF